MSLETIYIAVIKHKYGDNYYTARSKFGLKKQIADYCEEWWDKELYGPMPIDMQSKIDIYFGSVDREFLHIDLAKLLD